MTAAPPDPNRSLRWSVYTVLIALALGGAAGRLLAVNSVNRAELEQYRINRAVEAEEQRLTSEGVDGAELESRLRDFRAEAEEEMRLQRPFLSANDRSRWLTVRALVEHGEWSIDRVMDRHVWNTIDMVQHKDREGNLRLYSSKPPLLAGMVACEYWLINRVTGLTLADSPYVVGRTILLTINLPALAVMFLCTASLIDRLGRTDWGRIVAVATITNGTLLTPFAVVLNNHLIGAAAAAVALYFIVEIRSGRSTLRAHALAGLAAAFTATCELPALAMLVLMLAAAAWTDWRRCLAGFVPAAGVVAVAFFATNHAAHGTFTLPYMHRHAEDPEQNWYRYTYELEGRTIESHWNAPAGIDRGEPSRSVYALHTLVGHHGLFSLTPVWLLAALGVVLWLFGGPGVRREIAAAVLALSIVCLVFFIGMRPQGDRNYGGHTCGFRWMFWFAPLWAVPLAAGADRLAGSRTGRAITLVLLSFSVLSASYPTWNPWTHPWIYNWMEYLGWSGF